MKIIQKKFVNYMLFPGYKAINLFGIMFIKPNAKVDEVTINHESIHSEQIKEVMLALLIPTLTLTLFNGWFILTTIFSYYIWYLVEWVINLIKFKDWNIAYRNISFEKEAYENQYDKSYISKRELFAFFKYY